MMRSNERLSKITGDHPGEADPQGETILGADTGVGCPGPYPQGGPDLNLTIAP